MKKLWRSGMIDKKVVREREQAEYINKLERVILELTREEKEPKYAIVHTSDNRSHKVKIADKRCKADIEFGRKIEALENENNTRTLR